jgi:hypothetical protein
MLTAEFFSITPDLALLSHEDVEDAPAPKYKASDAVVQWAPGGPTPGECFDFVLYDGLETHWPTSYREADYRASRWLVAQRACQGTGLWHRYCAAERAFEEHGVRSADVELRETVGAAWRRAGLHRIDLHMKPPRRKHHSERALEQRKRRKRPPVDMIGLWLCPQLKAERAAAEQAKGQS